jgi:hypothetical protein
VPATIEIVRFEVPPQRREALIGGHLEARRAIREVSPPGDRWSRLARLGERSWLEVVAWDSDAVFERALEGSSGDERAQSWFDLAEPGWTIRIGHSAAAPSPPAEGGLDLLWSEEPTAPEETSSSGPDWSLDVRLGPRAWVDPSGWTELAPAALRISAATGSPAPERETALIASAVE